MKTLLILRHAKSSWDSPSLSDHDRPLNARGLKTAPLMGQLMREKMLVPDAIFSSTALRAVTTAKLIAKSVGFEKNIQTIPNFYPGHPVGYIKTLNTQATHEKIVMVIGHNPGLELLLETLTGHKERLPTAALAHVQLPVEDWSQLTNKTKGSLICVFRPKEIFKELQETN